MDDRTSWHSRDSAEASIAAYNRRTAGSPDIASARSASTALPPTLLCLSHLRWKFVYQRPQHLLSRIARHTRVLFFEEPLRGEPWLDVQQRDDGVTVLVPHLPYVRDAKQDELDQRRLLDAYLLETGVHDFGLWYYAPMSLGFTRHLHARARLIVYDCMDELAAFKGAPPHLIEREKRLIERADVVFTGERSLFEAKRRLHDNVHAFPSSVDIAHFKTACQPQIDPPDQAWLSYPRLGFCGVIDERVDTVLLGALARARPDWQFVLLGPVVKIDPEDLPRAPNLHYLGQKPYADLPRYLAGWDVALMPFALNEATRFTSPTKTPEYLAAGRPVVSTPIADVVATYGHTGAVHIAGNVTEFEDAIEKALADARDKGSFMTRAEAALAGMSWDKTCAGMLAEVRKCVS